MGGGRGGGGGRGEMGSSEQGSTLVVLYGVVYYLFQFLQPLCVFFTL